MQNEYLMHFNPFHDPKNGQFTSGGSSGGYREALKNVGKVDRKVNKDISKLAKLNSKQSRTFNKYTKKYPEQSLKRSKQNCLISLKRNILKYRTKLMNFKIECLRMNLKHTGIWEKQLQKDTI